MAVEGLLEFAISWPDQAGVEQSNLQQQKRTAVLSSWDSDHHDAQGRTDPPD